MSFMAFQGSIELGIIYAIMALGVFLSFRTLNFPDLTVDGSFVTGAAFSAIFCVGGYPELGLAVALLAGGLAGCVTALMHTKLEIQPLLAGILVMLGLYSVNLKIMGTRANIPLINKTTVFSLLDGTPLEEYAQLLIPLAILIILLLLLFLFLKTKLALPCALPATMLRWFAHWGSIPIPPFWLAWRFQCTVALAGALLAQYQSLPISVWV